MMDKYAGFMLTCETAIDESNSMVNNIVSYRPKVNVYYITFDANLQDFDVMNRNRRFYDKANVWNHIMGEKIQDLLRTGGWFGECGHPISYFKEKDLSLARVLDVPFKERAFKIMDPKINGNILSAKIQTACNNIGESMAKEVIAGWIPQFSLRSISTMVSKNGKPYVAVKQLVTYDSPWYPSHKIAKMTSKPERHAIPFTESASNDIKKDIVTELPIGEFIKDINDSNVNAFLESFDLSVDDVIGMNENHDHIIIRDDVNLIYAGISKENAHKVKDFLSSF